jgi:hypothetical protein
MAHAAKNPIAGVGEAAAEKGRWRKTAGRNDLRARADEIFTQYRRLKR